MVESFSFQPGLCNDLLYALKPCGHVISCVIKNNAIHCQIEIERWEAAFEFFGSARGNGNFFGKLCRNGVAYKKKPLNRPLRQIFYQQKNIVIALWTGVAACLRAEEDDGNQIIAEVLLKAGE